MQYIVPEISWDTARELASTGLGELLDVRQPCEIEISPSITGSKTFPLINMKSIMGKPMLEDEIGIDEDMLIPVGTIISMLNQHKDHGRILLCYCRSGRRSLEAAALLRLLGYPNAVSVIGGLSALETDSIQQKA